MRREAVQDERNRGSGGGAGGGANNSGGGAGQVSQSTLLSLFRIDEFYFFCFDSSRSYIISF